jgi:transposase InsO family protein
VVSLAEKRQAVLYLQKNYQVSERRSCRVLQLNRITKRRSWPREKEVLLRQGIHQLSERYPRFGYRKIFDKLKEEGIAVGRERVRLIRKQEGLQVIKKQKKRRLMGKSTTQLGKAEYPHHVWSYDLVADQTVDGRRVKCLTIVDEYTRYGLEIYSARSITAGHVQKVLQRLFAQWGTPTCIKSDNGPEFVARKIQNWLKETGVKTKYIDPGSPWQNGHNESFNSVFRDGCLNRWLFYSVQEAKRVIEMWLDEYNNERPHGALNGKTPVTFLNLYRGKKRNAA